MPWIHRVDLIGDRLTPISIDEHGQQVRASLRQLRATLPSATNQAAKVIGLELQELELAESTDYLRQFGIHQPDASRHEIYRFRHADRAVFVPAAVLLSALLARLSSFGDRLLDAASLDMLAQPRVRDHALRIEFHKASRLTSGKEHHEVQHRFVWLTCFASARRFWASVYARALEGKLGCRLPLAYIDASLYGNRVGSAIFVTRMNIKSLTPTESPLPFAAGLVPQTFLFNKAKTMLSSAALSAFRSKRNYRPPAQDDIPIGLVGWRMTDGEWLYVIDALKERGFVCKHSTKEVLDMALEKHGSGKPWNEVGKRVATAVTVYSDWNLTGKWDVLKAALIEVRGARSTRSKRAVDVEAPAPRQPLPQGPNGWQMTDEEWHAVADALQTQGFGLRLSSKERLNVALEKNGSGRTWEQVAPGDDAVIALHSLWRRTGRWKALEAALRALRTQPVT